MKRTFRTAATLIVGCAAASTGAARPAAPPEPAPIEYRISLPAPQTQMVDISMTIPDVESEALEVALPVWRPGRYEVLDTAGTVREVRAFDSHGDPLPIEKMRKSVWKVTAPGIGDVRIDYRVYANSLGDRTRHVDATHAFLSGSSVLMFSPQRRDSPARISIDAPPEWDVATGLEHVEGDLRTLIAPNYDVLVDSPLEIGVHERIAFEVLGKPHEIIIWGEQRFDEATLVEDFSKIIETQASIWGGLPYERYVFIVHAGRGGGGGTEHLNSTVMQTSADAVRGSATRSGAYERFLRLVAHEFFHTWNVKQLRPAGLVPYDYLEENYTRLLWVAEGTTSYYAPLTLVRAGLLEPREYLDSLSRAIDGYRRRPGSSVQSAEASSFDAWIKYNKSTPDDVNSTVSFYSVGSLLSFVLDMEVRSRTAGRASLDTVLREMYESFPLAGGGYTPQDLQETLERITGSSFEPFFARYVRRAVEPLFAEALAVVGLELDFDPAGGEWVPGDPIPVRADLGIELSGTTVRSVLSSGPAYAAGIQPGDELLAVGSQRIAPGGLDDLIEENRPGETVTLTFFHRDELCTADIVLGSRPDGEWTVRSVDSPTEAQETMYQDWLGLAAPIGEE